MRIPLKYIKNVVFNYSNSLGNSKLLTTLTRKNDFLSKNFVIFMLSATSHNNHRNNKNRCWNCGANLEKLVISSIFCKNCKKIQKPSNSDELHPSNFFYLFDLDSNFDLDLKELKTKFRNLQNEIHPDKFADKTKEEISYSSQQSSIINKAYETLKNPTTRAEHLLKIFKKKYLENSISEDSLSDNSSESSKNLEFLTKIVEINEEVENASISENPKENLKKIKFEIIEKIKKIRLKIGKSFSKQLENNQQQENKVNLLLIMKEVKLLIEELKYYESILKNIEEIMTKKEIFD